MINLHTDWTMIKGFFGTLLAGFSPFMDFEAWLQVSKLGGAVIQMVAGLGGIYLLGLSIRHKRLQIRSEKQNQKEE